MMKKRLLGAVCAAMAMALALTFTACGPSAPATVELVVWESVEGPDEFIKQAGEAFTKVNPGVTIKFVNVESGDSTSQIALDGPAEQGPDVFAAPHDKLGELVAGGHVLETVNAASVEAQLLDGCAQAVQYGGKMYGYPVSSETYALFYNKAYITDPPKTWDEVKTFSAGFNAANAGKYGFVMDVKNAYYTILFTTSGDNRLFGPDGADTTKTNINSDASVAGMTTFAGLREILNVPAADLDTAAVDVLFSGGKAAMHITGPWNVSSFRDAGIDFGVAALPALPGDSEPAGSFSGTRCMFVSAYSKHPAEAAQFAEFLISPAMQQLRYDITGALPSVPMTLTDEASNGFLAQMEYAFPMPSIPQMNNYWLAMNNASANIWDGADIKNELDMADRAILAP
ncbi:MAG: maltose ABC transporter substrate-binding protein [Clostridiales bacterium]|jgi:arabinogalactan oligomer/maltooligosaccharide transport system substrate-binding protein|nr:maltose ABC transporter substrate-binding protein [Clostridiales bacterium]